MAGNLDDLKNVLLAASVKMPDQALSIIEGEGLRFINKNFRDQGFNDNGLKKWDERKRNDHREGRAILVDKGFLRNSFSARRERLSVIFKSNAVYAQIHNEGGKITGTQSIRSFDRLRNGRTERVKAHSRTVNTEIPQRQFMGKSAYLDGKIRDKIKRTLDQLFRQ